MTGQQRKKRGRLKDLFWDLCVDQAGRTMGEWAILFFIVAGQDVDLF
jgi:hypothetical protein